MPTDLIRYDLLVQDALRGVVKTVLAGVAADDLPGDHHCYITFATTAPGVHLSSALHQRFPQEMTIVLQHQFSDLAVTDHGFEVKLHFSGVPERVHVPFAAIVRFEDPSVGFSLRFEQIDEARQAAPAPEKSPKSIAPRANQGLDRVASAEPPKREQRRERELRKEEVPADAGVADNSDKADDDPKIVSIDAFRKKP
jgi:hypothetical protein